MTSNLTYIPQDTAHLGRHRNSLQVDKILACLAHPSGNSSSSEPVSQKTPRNMLEWSGSS